MDKCLGRFAAVNRVFHEPASHEGVAVMTGTFFSRTADVAIAAALGMAFLYAAVSIGPIAIGRWF